MILQVTGAAQSCLTEARVVGEVAADVDAGVLLQKVMDLIRQTIRQTAYVGSTNHFFLLVVVIMSLLFFFFPKHL